MESPCHNFAMLQPSPIAFAWGVRKGLPAAGAAWQRKPGENHEGSGTMSNFTGVNGGFLRKACENHGKSHESQWRKGNLLAGKIVRWKDFFPIFIGFHGIRNGMMTSHSWFQWNLGMIRYSRRPFRPRHEIAKSPHLTGMLKDTLWQTNSLRTGKSPWLMGKATISTGPWFQ